MINYFIKFDDLSLSTVRLFTYDEGSKKQVKKYSLIDAKKAHADLEARKLTGPAILIP